MVLFLFFLVKIPFCEALSLNVKETFPDGYDFIFEGQIHNLALLEDKNTEFPLFQKDANLIFMNPREYVEQNEVYPWDEEVLNACFLTTNGQKASEENLMNRVAMQFYLYELDAKSKGEEIIYLFDPTEIQEIQRTLLEEGRVLLNQTSYSYTMVQNEWFFVSDLPWQGTYQLEAKEGVEYQYLSSSLKVKSDLVQDVLVKANVQTHQGQFHFYTSHDPYKPSYLLVEKPVTLLPIFHFHVKEKPKEHQIVFDELQEGYSLRIPDHALPNELVKFNLTIEEGYTLEQIIVKTMDGKEISMNHQSFLMPDEDVQVEIQMGKKEYHIIKQVQGMDVVLPLTARFGEVVEVTPILPKEYELLFLKVQTSLGEELELLDGKFVMPNQDVVILGEAKLNQYFLFYEEKEGISFHFHSSYFGGEEVSLEYQLQDHYELKNLSLIGEDNQKIDILNHKFVMPNQNVTLIVELQKLPQYKIQVLPVEGIQIHVPPTSYANEQVIFTVEQEDHYKLKELKFYTSHFKEIPYQENSFVMPEEDLFVAGVSVKKYPILVRGDDHLSIRVEEEAFAGDPVTITTILNDPNYGLKSLLIKRKNGEVLGSNTNEFIMPSEEVVLYAESEQRFFRVSVFDPDSVCSSIPNVLRVGERIYFMNVSDASRFDIECNVPLLSLDDRIGFEMPRHDVFLKLKPKPIVSNEEESNYEEYQDIPSTYKDNTTSMIGIFLAFLSIGVYVKKTRSA